MTKKGRAGRAGRYRKDRLMTNYYVADEIVCGDCVDKFDLTNESPIDSEMFAFMPIGCAIHVYGENPDNLRDAS